jgi:hypothetical protein
MMTLTRPTIRAVLIFFRYELLARVGQAQYEAAETRAPAIEVSDNFSR